MAPKTLLLGADGFIGRHLAFGLRDLGHEVVCVARNPAPLSRMGFETIAADFTLKLFQQPEVWHPHLQSVDHLVNAAGLLTGPPDAFEAVHCTAPAAIYQSMAEGATGVLISAVGIEAKTRFSRYRQKGEELARTHGITALRCGLVLGESAYGGSALIRGLAALPLVTPVPAGPDPQFNPIHATDLAAVVDAALRQPPRTQPLDIGGPETLGLRDMLGQYRQWLGLPPPRFLPLPGAVMQMLGAIGDFCRFGPISRTSLKQMQAGVWADTTRMHSEIAPRPRPFRAFASSRPAGSADLWHARLYLAKPAIRLVLALLWLLSGLIGLTLPPDHFLPLIDSTLRDETLILLARLSGILDLAIAAALIRDWHPKRTTAIQCGVILGYSAMLSWLNPALWLLPLGGLLKNIPILALLAVHAILQRER